MITVDILVIDSSPLIRYAIPAYLSRVQYEVTAVGDAQVIWERRRITPPALLITAWPMPGGHGIELVRHIRSLNGPHYTYTRRTRSLTWPAFAGTTGSMRLRPGGRSILFSQPCCT